MFFIFGLAGLFGLAVGSFLNVVIYRMGLNDDSNNRALNDLGARFRVLGPIAQALGLINGYSYCPHCKIRLKWFELIPVLSFIIQQRKCNSCGKPISWQYPLVELGTAVIFVLITLQYLNGNIQF